MLSLDPNTIIIQDRQRKAGLDIDENFVNSIKQRLIHPIVVRREEDSIVLVVGGRRLAAMIKAEINPIYEGTHFRFMDDLSPLEAKIIELEENAKRTDLHWRDHVSAVGELHNLYTKNNQPWNTDNTAKELNISQRLAYKFLMVYKNLNSTLLKDAQNTEQAFSILQNAAQRKTAAIINEIAQTGSTIFSETENEPQPESEHNNTLSELQNKNLATIASIIHTGVSVEASKRSSMSSSPSLPIICADFIDWATAYSGPKFNLIHCDFPYDIDYSKYAKSVTSSNEDYNFKGFMTLLDSLCENLDKIASYSAHLVVWFSMDFYQETKLKLQSTGLYVHAHPLIWFKSDNAGIIPGRDNMFPRRVYETALLCSRGKRPLIKSLSNLYAAPTPQQSTHPSQKSEPMLRHFLSMLIDETTDFLDPTCGSGSAIRAAEDLGARTVLGIEKDPQYAQSANLLTENTRRLRRAVG